MFFGLINSLATFKGFMNSILKDLINKSHIIVYLDNILVYTIDLKEYDQLVRQVLQVLR